MTIEENKSVTIHIVFTLPKDENREKFLRRVGYFFPTLDERFKKLEKAYDTAKDAFRGIKRERGGASDTLSI